LRLLPQIGARGRTGLDARLLAVITVSGDTGKSRYLIDQMVKKKKAV